MAKGLHRGKLPRRRIPLPDQTEEVFKDKKRYSRKIKHPKELGYNQGVMEY